MDVAKETDVIQLSGLFFYFAAVTETVMDSLETTDVETTTAVSGSFSYFAAVDVAEITTAAASKTLKEEQFYPVPPLVFSSDLYEFASNGI